MTTPEPFDPSDCAFCVAPTTRRLSTGAAASCPIHGGTDPDTGSSFTDADVDLAAQAMRNANTAESWAKAAPMVPLSHYAHAALTALDAAGRLATDDALTDARKAARELARREREHLGAGPEGHLNLDDLAPLLHALNINPEETP